VSNLFRNPRLEGPWTTWASGGIHTGPYEHGVHYWKLGDVRVEAKAQVRRSAGPTACPRSAWSTRSSGCWTTGRTGSRVRDSSTGRHPRAPRRTAAAPIERILRLVYWGRSEGHGYVHTRIQGPHVQNDPESIAWRGDWRRIEHEFISTPRDARRRVLLPEGLASRRLPSRSAGSSCRTWASSARAVRRDVCGSNASHRPTRAPASAQIRRRSSGRGHLPTSATSWSFAATRSSRATSDDALLSR